MCISAFIVASFQKRGLTLFRTEAMPSAFCVPPRLRVGELGLVTGLGRSDQVGGDQDVLPQLSGQLVAGSLAVERLDGVADVGLIREQPADRGLLCRERRWSG